jgi:hypothetical protein
MAHLLMACVSGPLSTIGTIRWHIIWRSLAGSHGSEPTCLGAHRSSQDLD